MFIQMGFSISSKKSEVNPMNIVCWICNDEGNMYIYIYNIDKRLRVNTDHELNSSTLSSIFEANFYIFN